MLTEDVKNKITSCFSHGSKKKAAAIDALLIAQEKEKWISDDLLLELSNFLEMTPEELDGIATFYNRIYRKPVGRHVILLCDSAACFIMNVGQLYEILRKELDISFGETTKDGRFTLLPIQCLGLCDHAPALMIDRDTYTDLSQEKIKVILESYQ